MNAVRLRVQRLKKKLGLASDVCAYMIRHSYGTFAVVNGVDVATVAELMGHVDTTMVTRLQRSASCPRRGPRFIVWK